MSGVNHNLPRSYVVLITIFISLLFTTLRSAAQDPSTIPPSQSFLNIQNTPHSFDDVLNTYGQKLTKMEHSWEVFTPLETASTPTTKTVRIPVWLRFLSAIPLDNGWRLNFLAYSLFIDRWTTTLSTPNSPSTTTHESGRGDAGLQATFSHDLNERWSFGVGARLQGPTAGRGILSNTADAELGSGNWQIMPWFQVRAAVPELSQGAFFAPTMRWATSFSGNLERRRINEPQIRPTFNFDINDRWFVTLYPTYAIRVNFGGSVPGQTGRLFLPADGLIGYKLNDTLQVSLQAAVPIIRDYPVYNLFTMLWFRGNF